MPRKKIDNEVKETEKTLTENVEETVRKTRKKAEKKAEEASEKPVKKTAAKKTTKKAAETAETEKKTAAKKTTKKAAEASETEKKTAAKKPAAKKTTAKKAAAEEKEAAPKKTTRRKSVKKAVEETPVTETVIEEAAPVVEEAAPAVEEAAPVVEEAVPAVEEAVPAVEKASAVEEEAPAEETVPAEVVEEPVYDVKSTPRRSIAFIGSECHPFVKTGGLGDVMYALPRALVNLNCDVRVILPRYECIPQKYQDKMVYRGEFYMDLGETGRNWYVGIMEYVCDGVVYDFIDNQEFFSGKKPYTNLVDDIPKYCYFAKAALAALNYMNWIPNVIHCHDWQAGLVPVFLKTLFKDTALAGAKTVITIHNLRFQGIYNIPTFKYWTGLPDEVFTMECMKQGVDDANMLKGGLAYADRISTVSGTYAQEIQTEEYGENLEEHLQFHAGKLRGIVNGIDIDMWNPATDASVPVNYDITNVLPHKKENKLALQKELGLEEDEGKFVIGLISRLTDQKGLDLVNAIIPAVMDGNTQIAVLGTGEAVYEDSFRGYENAYKGSFAACIQYDEARAHRIYAGADALLVPSRFEPCGLTQLNAMHYGTVPIVRETGGLKDTVQPYNQYTNDGNGFTFDKYDAGLLLDAVNRAKTFYFTNRWCFDEMVQRDMAKDVSWENSAKQYKNMYLELTQW